MTFYAGQVLTADDMQLISGARIATAIVTSASANFTTEIEVMTVTATLISGRTYRVKATPAFASTVDDDVVLAQLREDDTAGTIMHRGYVDIRGAGTSTRNFMIPLEAEYTPVANESKTFIVTGQRVTGTGSTHLQAAGTYPAYLYVDYIRG